MKVRIDLPFTKLRLLWMPLLRHKDFHTNMFKLAQRVEHDLREPILSWLEERGLSYELGGDITPSLLSNSPWTLAEVHSNDAVPLIELKLRWGDNFDVTIVPEDGAEPV